jgi:hypothetical protein
MSESRGNMRNRIARQVLTETPEFYHTLVKWWVNNLFIKRQTELCKMSGAMDNEIDELNPTYLTPPDDDVQ